MMQAAERKQVLEMLSEGRISVEDAQRLLDRLEASSPGAEARPGGSSAKPTPRYLRVVVDSPQEGERVNLRVPIGLLRAGLKLGGMLPDWVVTRAEVEGVDLAAMFRGLEGAELIEALNELDVSVDSSDGEKVRIFCE